MRIVHVCLAAFYIDKFSYQENVLPRMHKLQGNDVMILASTETVSSDNQLDYVKPSRYINCDGIPVIRLPYVSWLPKVLVRKLRLYPNVYVTLCEFKPDVIFLHDVQFLSIHQIKRYVKGNQTVKIIADGHADYINSARGFISKYILHGLIYRYAAQTILPYIMKFYGTLPSRERFFREMYHIPQEKIGFLPMGADDTLVEIVKGDGSRAKIRRDYGFSDDDYILITGGKIDEKKIETLNLMDAVIECPDNVKLIVFGAVAPGIKKDFESRLVPNKITMFGWANEKQSYQLLNAADIAVFPCYHSTLWEQSAGIGLPCILHEIEGFTHININNNCYMVKKCDKKDLVKAIKMCIKNYPSLRNNAIECASNFSYDHIAKDVLKGLI